MTLGFVFFLNFRSLDLVLISIEWCDAMLLKSSIDWIRSRVNSLTRRFYLSLKCPWVDGTHVSSISYSVVIRLEITCAFTEKGIGSIEYSMHIYAKIMVRHGITKQEIFAFFFRRTMLRDSPSSHVPWYNLYTNDWIMKKLQIWESGGFLFVVVLLNSVQQFGYNFSFQNTFSPQNLKSNKLDYCRQQNNNVPGPVYIPKTFAIFIA